ncbi:MAG: hypothetical protein ACQEQL_03720 [Pseudomonadota bacterium]
MVSSPNDSHALVEGCRPDVWEATKATAEGRVAANVAAAEEVSNQPDSVLALSCADQAFRVSAAEGGQIFSGDFTSEMKQVVNDPMQEMLSENFLDSIGNSSEFSNVVGLVVSDLLADAFPAFFNSSNYDCTVMQDLYDDYVTSGIDGNAPYLSLDDMVTTAFSASPTNNFLANFAAEGPGGVFDELQSARSALPPNVIPSATGSESFNDVLSAVGIIP